MLPSYAAASEIGDTLKQELPDFFDALSSLSQQWRYAAPQLKEKPGVEGQAIDATRVSFFNGLYDATVALQHGDGRSACRAVRCMTEATINQAMCQISEEFAQRHLSAIGVGYWERYETLDQLLEGELTEEERKTWDVHAYGILDGQDTKNDLQARKLPRASTERQSQLTNLGELYKIFRATSPSSHGIPVSQILHTEKSNTRKTLSVIGPDFEAALIALDGFLKVLPAFLSPEEKLGTPTAATDLYKDQIQKVRSSQTPYKNFMGKQHIRSPLSAQDASSRLIIKDGQHFWSYKDPNLDIEVTQQPPDFGSYHYKNLIKEALNSHLKSAAKDQPFTYEIMRSDIPGSPIVLDVKQKLDPLFDRFEEFQAITALTQLAAGDAVAIPASPYTPNGEQPHPRGKSNLGEQIFMNNLSNLGATPVQAAQIRDQKTHELSIPSPAITQS